MSANQEAIETRDEPEAPGVYFCVGCGGELVFPDDWTREWDGYYYCQPCFDYNDELANNIGNWQWPHEAEIETKNPADQERKSGS